LRSHARGVRDEDRGGSPLRVARSGEGGDDRPVKRGRYSRDDDSRVSEKAIERRTAWSWVRRALGRWKKYRKTRGRRWRDEARDFAHEALEHAAMAKDYGRTVALVQRAIDEIV